MEEVKQAERSGFAAQRLLAVTCDASARLTADLCIAQPSPSLADLMMCRLSHASNFLEGATRPLNAAGKVHFRCVARRSSIVFALSSARVDMILR